MFGFLLCFAAGNDLGRERRHHFLVLMFIDPTLIAAN
jgi:hypothetical protein